MTHFFISAHALKFEPDLEQASRKPQYWDETYANQTQTASHGIKSTSQLMLLYSGNFANN